MTSWERESAKKPFCICWYVFVCIVGAAFWRKYSAKMTISKMVTVSSEAFALLVLENYWDTWSTKNFETYQKEATYDEKTNKKEL